MSPYVQWDEELASSRNETAELNKRLTRVRCERDAARAEAATLREQLAKVEAERDEARATNRDLHRRTQKAERFRDRWGGSISRVLNRLHEARCALRAAEARAKAAEAETARMREALRAVRQIITDGAMTGFNCHDGDWAERLFLSQGQTSRAIGHDEPARAALSQIQNEGGSRG